MPLFFKRVAEVHCVNFAILCNRLSKQMDKRTDDGKRRNAAVMRPTKDNQDQEPLLISNLSNVLQSIGVTTTDCTTAPVGPCLLHVIKWSTDC
jgi:hypothetical protein